MNDVVDFDFAAHTPAYRCPLYVCDYRLMSVFVRLDVDPLSGWKKKENKARKKKLNVKSENSEKNSVGCRRPTE